MKKIFFSLEVLSNISTSKSNQFETIRKFNNVLQTVSQEISAQAMNNPTRSTTPQTHKSYALTLIEKLEQEVQIIANNKSQDELTQEEKDLIQMLETYIKAT